MVTLERSKHIITTNTKFQVTRYILYKDIKILLITDCILLMSTNNMIIPVGPQFQ